MRFIDRYLFRQFLGPTMFAGATLSLVALLAESLTAIGVILNQRQTLIVFLKVVLLAMPQLIVLVMPVAVLVGGLAATGRLKRDNEVAICFAGGMSRSALIDPAIRLASLLALACLVINLWIQPLCYRLLRETLSAVRTDLAANLIKPGQFSHPVSGVTVYARSFDPDGAIKFLFIDRRRESGHDTTIMAASGRIEAANTAPMLVLRHGVTQDLAANGKVTFLAFDTYVLDLRPLWRPSTAVRYKPSDRFMHELLFPGDLDAWEIANRGAMIAEAHSRVATPLYAVAFMLLSLAAVLEGGFARTDGVGRIILAVVIAIIGRTLGFAAQAAGSSYPLLNAGQYLAPIAVGGLGLWALFHHRVTGATARRQPRATS